MPLGCALECAPAPPAEPHRRPGKGQVRDMENDYDAQATALTRWEEEGGARPSAAGIEDEARRDAAVHHATARATFDATHDSSARGEHRYPDAQQTKAERDARNGRDDFKRRIAGR